MKNVVFLCLFSISVLFVGLAYSQKMPEDETLLTSPAITGGVTPLDESNIIGDSELGYTIIYHPGDLQWNRKEEPPYGFHYLAVCKNSNVDLIYRWEWMDGRSKVISRKKAKLKEYLKLWEELEKNDIWALESPMEAMKKARTEDENPYEKLLTDQETFLFKLRINGKEHKLKAYYIDGLKDKRYKAILDAMDRFFRVERKTVY